MAYDRQIASALRAIAAKGELCVWEKPAEPDPLAKKWRDVRTGDAPDPPQVSIAWFPPDGAQMKYAQENGGVPEGFEIGLMGSVDFEPKNAERIFRSDGTDPVTVFKLECLKPDGTPILWTVWVRR